MARCGSDVRSGTSDPDHDDAAWGSLPEEEIDWYYSQEDAEEEQGESLRDEPLHDDSGAEESDTDERRRACREVSAAFKRATAGTDSGPLADAIVLAEKLGVDMEEVMREDACMEQQKVEAAEVLDIAMKSEDYDMLAAAITAAKDAGVDSKTLAEAKQRRLMLSARQRRLELNDKATQELESAVAGSDVTALAAAIHRAMRSGVTPELVQLARKRCHVLRDEARRDKASAVAVRRLKAAMCSIDAAALTQAIDWAESLDAAGVALLGQARARRAVLEERFHPVGLEDESAAQPPSDAGVRKDVVARARLRRSARENRDREREEAISALSYATIGTDVEALDSVIEWAVSLDVPPEAIEPAQKRKAALQVLEDIPSMSRFAAEDTESMALREEATAALGCVLDDEPEQAWAASDAGAPSQPLHAVPEPRAAAPPGSETDLDRLVDVLEPTQEVLESATSGTNTTALAAAIAWGTESGVRADLLEDARRKRAWLERDHQGEHIGGSPGGAAVAPEGGEASVQLGDGGGGATKRQRSGAHSATDLATPT